LEEKEELGKKKERKTIAALEPWSLRVVS